MTKKEEPKLSKRKQKNSLRRYGNRGDEQVRQSPFFQNPREKYIIGLYVLKTTQIFFFNLKG